MLFTIEGPDSAKFRVPEAREFPEEGDEPEEPPATETTAPVDNEEAPALPSANPESADLVTAGNPG